MEFAGESHPPLLVRVQDHLRVCVSAEAVAVPLEFFPQFQEVVDLAVVGRPGVAVFAGQGRGA